MKSIPERQWKITKHLEINTFINNLQVKKEVSNEIKNKYTELNAYENTNS